MEKKKLNKRKKRVISIAVIATAFVICIMATFGVTMAYFGGTSGAAKGEMTLKSAVWVNGSALTSFSGYVLPSQLKTQACTVKVKSAATSTGAALKDASATSALLRATITITTSGGAASIENSIASFPVSVAGATAYLVKYTDQNYYLMTANATTGNMYVVDTSKGEVTLTYTISIVIPDTIKNADVAGGGKITVSVQYNVIQSDFYGGTATAQAKTIANAKTIFDATTDSASYA